MNSEETKTAYPVTCHICKGEFVVYAYPDELENLEGQNWSLFNCDLCGDCWTAIGYG
jgi:hypothetical protein